MAKKSTQPTQQDLDRTHCFGTARRRVIAGLLARKCDEVSVRAAVDSCRTSLDLVQVVAEFLGYGDEELEEAQTWTLRAICMC